MPLEKEDESIPMHIIVCNTPGCGGKIYLELHEKGDFACPNKCGFEVNKAKADAPEPAKVEP